MEELIIYLGGLDVEDNPETDSNETYYENSQISGGKAKDKYKAITQMYNKMISGPRKSFLISASKDIK